MISQSPFSRRALWLGCCVALGVLTGCGRSGNGGEPGGGGAPGMGLGGRGMPPQTVGVVTVELENVTVTAELPGRVVAERTAEMRARVTGIVQKRLFEEGTAVRADQVLFEIDPAPLQAAYASAKASLARAEATRDQAKADAKRKEALVKVNGVSQQAYEEAKTAALEGDADVLAAQAALESAALNLGYTKVTAPISGRIGKALVTEGALASAGEATQLAVIQQLDPIYVDFTQSSADMLKLRRALEAGKLQGLTEASVKITLVLEDGSAYDKTGRLVFTDTTVDVTTGSVLLRGEFPNPQHLLLPGMFVRGKVETAQAKGVITVPQRGVTRDSHGQASVQLVNAQNQVEQRDIETGASAGARWVVTRGLSGGEKVIVEGLQKVRAGATVNPVPFDSATPNLPPAN